MPGKLCMLRLFQECGHLKKKSCHLITVNEYMSIYVTHHKDVSVQWFSSRDVPLCMFCVRSMSVRLQVLGLQTCVHPKH